MRYEIRGRLARRAHELERQGYEIISLNIGNPRAFGLRTPETMRLAMIENLGEAEGYCHQKGIFPAREAVVMQQQARGITGVTAEEVFIGNGVSELIDLTLRALLNEGDEVLVPSPDYPLWTAAVTLNRGRAVHYPCRPENGFVPDPEEVARLITPRTRAHRHHQSQQPHRCGLSARRARSAGAARRGARLWCVFSDEIYDQMTYADAEFVPMATLVHDTLCARRSRGCPRSTAPAVTASAGRCSPGACTRRPTTCTRSSCCPRCACAATSWRSGRCRPRSAATRASASSSPRAGGCTSRARRSWMPRSSSRFLTLAPPAGRDVRLPRRRTAGAAGLR